MKYIKTIIDERDNIQSELEKIKKQLKETLQNLENETAVRVRAEEQISTLQGEVENLDQSIAKIIEQTTQERDHKYALNLSYFPDLKFITKFNQFFTCSSPQNDYKMLSSAKNLQNLSEKFQMMMDEAASSIKPEQTDYEKLRQLKKANLKN